MKRLNIEIHENLLQELKIFAAKKNISIKVFITKLILNALKTGDNGDFTKHS